MNHLVFTESLPDIKGCDVDYLFEVADKFDAPEIVERELKIWDEFVEDGFSTVPEHLTAIPRSDCHAWSASPALLDGKYFL